MSEEHYSKRSFEAILVDEEGVDDIEPQPGQFYYLNLHGVPVGIASCLPNAKDEGASWGVTMFSGYPGQGPKWTWDGNLEKPTLSPSIHRIGHWHGHLTAGQFRSCE